MGIKLEGKKIYEEKHVNKNYMDLEKSLIDIEVYLEISVKLTPPTNEKRGGEGEREKDVTAILMIIM